MLKLGGKGGEVVTWGWGSRLPAGRVAQTTTPKEGEAGRQGEVKAGR